MKQLRDRTNQLLQSLICSVQVFVAKLALSSHVADGCLGGWGVHVRSTQLAPDACKRVGGRRECLVAQTLVAPVLVAQELVARDF